MIEQVKTLLIDKFGEHAILRLDEQGLQPILLVNPDFIVEICFFLRDTEGFYFDFYLRVKVT